MNDLVEQLLRSRLLEEALDIWLAGGWAMIALAVNAFVLFAIGFNLWLHFRTGRFRRVAESTWRRWISNPDERQGAVGEMVSFVMDASNLKEMSVRFSEIHATQVAPFTRDLKFMRRAVSTAPLLGLLGTVTGMLTTFTGLASGSGGQKTMDLVAGGISEALITTETGLMIALLGLFFQYHLSRQRDRYETFLAHLETVCTQFLCVSAEAGRATSARHR
jgi:biopolymer transport protein ExbB